MSRVRAWLVCSFALQLASGAARLVRPDQLPLRTRSRWIVDSAGSRVKLSCVNWSGGAQKDGVPGGLQHQPAGAIAQRFARMGFNCVRLPWSVATVLAPHRVANQSLLAANPGLLGKSTAAVLDAVVTACAAARLMVVLDCHMSDPDWCCSEEDSNGLWYNDHWSEASWIRAHTALAERYNDQPYVVAGELRNELRQSTVGGRKLAPSWGDGHNATDWKAAAERAAAAILKVRPEGYLIVVDGLAYSTDFRKAFAEPIRLSVPDRLVYSAHDYSWSQPAGTGAQLDARLGDYWGFLVSQRHSFTAPVWVSEFGTWHDGRDLANGWWPELMDYLEQADFDWAYWRGDGTESRGTGRSFGAPAGFGVLNASWDGPAADGELLRQLQRIQKATQGPGIDRPSVPFSAAHKASRPDVTVLVGDLLPESESVAPNFVGLSIEVGSVLRMIGMDGTNRPLAALIGHLYQLTAGPHPGATLRLGGNSADDSAYLNSSGPLPPGIKYSIGERDLKAYVRFASDTARAANVSFVIDTNFGTSSDPRKFALRHVEAVTKMAGLMQHVSGVEVGNEMDLYHEHSII